MAYNILSPFELGHLDWLKLSQQPRLPQEIQSQQNHNLQQKIHITQKQKNVFNPLCHFKMHNNSKDDIQIKGCRDDFGSFLHSLKQETLNYNNKEMCHLNDFL